MLTTPDHVFVPCVPKNGFQVWLFHHLPWVYGETIQTVVFYLVLFRLFFFPQELKGLLEEILDCRTKRNRSGFKDIFVWEEFGLSGFFPTQHS